jgi:hypothetical protein
LQRQHETAELQWHIKRKEKVNKRNLYRKFFPPTDAQLDILNPYPANVENRVSS